MTIRVAAADVEYWRQQANLQGMNMSEWIRKRCGSSQPEGTVENGSANPENVSRPTDVRPSGRRSAAPRGLRAVAERSVDNAGVESNDGRKQRTCEHGVKSGYHCWKCRGIAKTQNEAKK